MKKLITVFMLLSAVVYAEEQLIGKIAVTDGGYATNYSTGYLAAGCPVGESCNQAFALPSKLLVTVQCDQPAVVSVSRASNDAGIGVVLAANQALFTDTGKLMSRGVLTPDGGTYYGAVISVSPTPGVGANVVTTCSVHNRNGLE